MTFYITTAIDYVNAKPHIGHAYEKVIADIIARWQRLTGKEVFYLTGTDENAQKNSQAAKEAGIPTKKFVDENVKYSWLLRGMPIFDELSVQDLDQLAAWLEPQDIKAGEVLFNEGDPGDKFYIVESGEVVISRIVDDQEAEISRREPGEYFGEIALLQNRPRTATIKASIDTRLLSLKAEYFQKLLSNFMQLGATVSRTSSRRLTFVEAAGGK